MTSQLRDSFYYMAGIGFLGLAKAKHMLEGYSSPKPLDISHTDECIAYDIKVADHWLSHLEKYTAGDCAVAGKAVLELGPGSDLGAGIYLLSKGCSRYYAHDVNDLMKGTPDAFYDALFMKLGCMANRGNIDLLRRELSDSRSGRSSRLSYVVNDDFDLVSAFGTATMELVFSQAAFEHFDDVEETCHQLTQVCKPGAVLIAEIDLKTHSRWIRDRDPNNIYRYSDDLYNAFWFRGIPNRVRPYQYKKALERFGWTNISITPLEKVSGCAMCSGLDRRFMDGKNEMQTLTVMLCATNGMR